MDSRKYRLTIFAAFIGLSLFIYIYVVGSTPMQKDLKFISQSKDSTNKHTGTIAPLQLSKPITALRGKKMSLNAWDVKHMSDSINKVYIDSLNNRNLTDTIYFAHIGANIGSFPEILDSPTHAGHEMHLHQLFNRKNLSKRGVIIEAVPSVFATLKENAEKFNYVPPEYHLMNVAVGDKNGTTTFYSVDADLIKKEKFSAQIPNWFYYQIGSFDIQHILKNMDHSQPWSRPALDYIKNITVTVVDADYIVNFLGGYINLLYVDAEGYDWNIVKSFLKYSPSFILFEVKHVKNDVWKTLSHHHYACADSDPSPHNSLGNIFCVLMV